MHDTNTEKLVPKRHGKGHALGLQARLQDKVVLDVEKPLLNGARKVAALFDIGLVLEQELDDAEAFYLHAAVFAVHSNSVRRIPKHAASRQCHKYLHN